MKVELNFLEKFNLAKICLEVFLAFVRSGYVDLPSGNIGSVGRSSGNWSRTFYSFTYAYNLWITYATVGSSNSDYNYRGFPLRCLYPGSA